MKKLLFTLLTLALAAPNYAQTFTVPTEEGVNVTYYVLDEDEKTCTTDDEGCISTSTVGKVTIPDIVNGYYVTEIGEYSFEGCSNVTEVVLPKYLSVIWDRAFWGAGIEQVTIGDVDGSYTDMPLEIYDQAFGNCPNLKTITLGQNVTFEGSGLFTNCPVLHDVYSYIAEPSAIGNIFPFSNEGLTLYVPAGTKEVYENTAGWSSFPNIVEMGGATAIQDVNGTKAVTSVKYHNLAGMVSDRPFDGVNIVTTTRADGTTTTAKVLR